MKFMLCLYSTVLLSCIAFSTQLEPRVLLRGTVTYHNQPIQAEMLFRSDGIAPTRVRSAPDGSYQAVLKPAKTYTVLIVTENLERYTFTYTIPSISRYTELEQNFTLGQDQERITRTQSKQSPAKSQRNKKSTKRKRS